jgi:hypothetical protein
MTTEPQELLDLLGALQRSLSRTKAAPVSQEPPAPVKHDTDAHTSSGECTCGCRAWWGGAQEPADPPWLHDAITTARVAYGHMYDGDPDVALNVAQRLVRAALPILRAGIEAEYHAKLTREIGRMP